jgi:hypothetical protein
MASRVFYGWSLPILASVCGNLVAALTLKVMARPATAKAVA